MDKKKLLLELFDEKILNILEYILYSNDEMNLSKISKETNVSNASTHRILNKLEGLNIIKTKKIGKFKIYSNKDNELTNFLKTFIEKENKPIKVFINKISKIESVKKVIMNNEPTKKSVDLIILVKDKLDEIEIRKVVNEVSERENFLIKYTLLNQRQYEQMEDMNLFGKKKILFER